MAALIAFSSSAVLAVPRFEVIDVGVPTNGSVVMTGYRGYVVRAVSDVGPITRIDLADEPERGLLEPGYRRDDASICA